LFALWGLVVASQLLAIARQRGSLIRLLHSADPSNDPALLALVAELSGILGLPRPPEVITAEVNGSPFVCGLTRPVLVLPRGLAQTLDPAALR
jgi:hypothetical protein